MFTWCPFVRSKEKMGLDCVMHSISTYELMANTHPWLKSEQQRQQQQQQQHPAAAHKAFTKGGRGCLQFSFITHFSCFLPVLLSSRKEIWKNRCCCFCCGICEGVAGWMCPRQLKIRTIFFFCLLLTQRRRHTLFSFYQFFGVGCRSCDVFCVRLLCERLWSPVPDNEFRMTSHMTP